MQNLDIGLGELVTTFLGAFLGFGLSLIIDRIVTHRNERIALINSISVLKKELEDVQEAINSSTYEVQIKCYIPIWSAIINSASLFIFNRKKYYMQILGVYTNIQEMNRIEASDPPDYSEIKRTRKKVSASILDLLKNDDFNK